MRITFFMGDDLKKNISLLPIDIQKKICILSWRLFWREYVPLTAQIPSWYESKILIEAILYKSMVRNIHFLHLPFNTLEENKIWIMGCQCNFCSKIKYKYTYKEYGKLADDPYYLQDKIPISDGKYTYLNSYDPFHGSIYEDPNKYKLRTNTKLKFDIIF